ncbi:dnaJ homolog subfamily C member 28 isoform X3 [Arabidopsis lyrata subsp. lyrata]|uniref:dnaJ homolog subfamily C member 28 isoform X3 n=1 Tax=Arabidopsis lyrata subsp. lyrata TaxID=81972 RepID=UPI000A29DD8E|nr:dnaJ homolog subfamily C member 28 isoform X3 [Arabidopsis lyrata subsp. lyrata]|eukprot:XP_020876515.1 dnaJ homolog subfamily C member 28 isoform X3 [Arabidopsis lyrata subsp. lyrata]
MAVRLARSLAASRPSRGNRCSASVITSSAINGGEFSDFHRAFAFYSSSSSWWSSPEDLTAGSKRIEKNTTDRLSAVIDAVHDRKLPPELRGRRDFVRSETDIINVVEQRIWHSMEEGHFENLPGKGKPLNLHTNPHADPAEDTLYRILNKNGVAPEWVELNKEIRNKAKEWRISLKKAWTMKLEEDQSGWEERSDLLKKELKQINNMVFRYNLIVPFGRQMFGLKWEKEIDLLKD